MTTKTQWDEVGESCLVGAKRGGYEIAVYDESPGPLWIFRNSIGIMGICRACTWEDAAEVCEDEFQPEADETVDELVKEYGFRRKHIAIVREAGGLEREAVSADYPLDKNGLSFVRWETRETPDPGVWMDNALFQDAYGFRPNGANARDKIGHGIYAKGLNWESLDRLTPEMAGSLGITLEWENH